MILLDNIVLNNGLKIFYKQLDNTHSMSFDFFVKTGVRYESRNENGISNLLGALHYRGINGYDQKQLFYKMETIGSSIQIFTYKDFMRFSMKIHPNYYKECIDIFKNIFVTYYWDEETLEKEKKTILKQIDEENRYVDIDKIVSENYYGESGLSLPIKGCYDTINQITVNQISDFKKHVFNRDSIAFYFSGPIRKEHIEYIKTSFSDVYFLDETIVAQNIIPKNFCNRVQNLFWDYNKWDYVDVDISFDVSIKKKEIMYLDILNCILGEGIGSKLQNVLREKLSLVFDIKSFIEKYDLFNVLHIQYSVKKSDFMLSFQTVLNVLCAMKREITDFDIDASLPFYRENLEFLFDDPQKYNFYYAYNSFILNNSSDICVSVLPKDIMDLAKKIFKKTNVVVTCLGDDSKVAKKELQRMLDELEN